MIDKLVLRAEFQTDPLDFRIQDLEIPLEGSLEPDGSLYNLRHPWESLPSSYGGVAFKVFDMTHLKDGIAWIELKASPAKVMQGHNLYGSDNLAECAFALVEVLGKHYPQILDDIAIDTWQVAEADITFASWAGNEREASNFINSLAQVSKGQTRARTGYSGTVYFGKKNSRLKKIKVYDKFKEIVSWMAKEDRRGDQNNILQYYTPELLEWAKGMVRWEATLKHRWFERRGISTNLFELRKNWNSQKFWTEAMKDLFEALDGEEMKIVKDPEIEQRLKDQFLTINAKTGNITYGKAMSAYRTYRAIKAEGYEEAKRQSTSRTFYRHLEMLKKVGLSRALLQNLTGNAGGAEIVPLIRYAKVEFGEQTPPWAEAS